MARDAPALTAESGTLTAGVVTLGGALSGGYRPFSDGMTADGNTVHVVVKDGSDVHSWRDATWDQGSNTLTLGAEEGNTGTLFDGAVEVWAVAQIGIAHNTLTPSSNAVTIPMDGRAHILTLPSGGITSVTLSGISGADMTQHWCSVIINPPATGTESFSIPVAWKKYGPLDTISLADTDEPVILVLQTLGDNATTPTIAYTAQGGS